MIDDLRSPPGSLVFVAKFSMQYQTGFTLWASWSDAPAIKTGRVSTPGIPCIVLGYDHQDCKFIGALVMVTGTGGTGWTKAENFCDQTLETTLT